MGPPAEAARAVDHFAARCKSVVALSPLCVLAKLSLPSALGCDYRASRMQRGVSPCTSTVNSPFGMGVVLCCVWLRRRVWKRGRVAGVRWWRSQAQRQGRSYARPWVISWFWFVLSCPSRPGVLRARQMPGGRDSQAGKLCHEKADTPITRAVTGVFDTARGCGALSRRCTRANCAFRGL